MIMNKVLSLLFLFLLIAGCEKEESNLELFNPEAFAYDLGNSWEVNAMINVKGFEQHENDESKQFEASISFSANLKTTDGRIIENVYSDDVDYSLDEEIIDIPLEIQFELDSTYVLGKYQINLSVEDNFTGDVISGIIEFDLTD